MRGVGAMDFFRSKADADPPCFCQVERALGTRVVVFPQGVRLEYARRREKSDAGTTRNKGKLRGQSRRSSKPKRAESDIKAATWPDGCLSVVTSAGSSSKLAREMPRVEKQSLGSLPISGVCRCASREENVGRLALIVGRTVQTLAKTPKTRTGTW
ncbi:hypothetical protein KM043_010544 [Ampulex compressa]|nr:hypothetical protein KM043_010544 [Ampulex compressa]